MIVSQTCINVHTCSFWYVTSLSLSPPLSLPSSLSPSPSLSLSPSLPPSPSISIPPSLPSDDVVTEQAILKWYNDSHLPKGKTVFLPQMKKMVEWLKTAEEESEEGETLYCKENLQ